MKLYTRLINEGVFIFWNSDEGNTSYKLKIKIVVGDDKIELVNLDINKGENYYSFNGIGSGDYEIELNGFKDNHLYQTETKKIKTVSSAQKEQEQTDKIMDSLSDISSKLHSISSRLHSIDVDLSGIETNTSYISRLTELTDPQQAGRFLSEAHGWEDHYRR